MLHTYMKAAHRFTTLSDKGYYEHDAIKLAAHCPDNGQLVSDSDDCHDRASCLELDKWR